MKDILLLHGAIGSAAQLSPLENVLANSCRVHTLDFPGHGGTTMPEKFSIASFAAFVVEFLESRQLQQVDVFGYSMGGYVAMYIARHYEKRYFNYILTLGTKYHWDVAVAEKETRMLDADVIERKVPAFAESLKQRHAPNDWKTVLAKTAAMLQEMGMANPLQQSDYLKIHQRTLVMLGDGDKMVSREESEAVAGALASGKFILLPGTPHPIEQVNSSLLAGEIERFTRGTF